MKDPSERTKVVVRHLPPSILQAALTEQIDGRFAGRYDWFSFRPGKNSQKDWRHSQAYINFKRLEDVVEFAEFFDGHIFVNEKGAQFKVSVEYAPSQRVPKTRPKKDGREGTISKDPEYMEFLELISKPVEHLPSAEIQLERKEAERAGATKEPLIVTPLMEFVRRKRAAKSGTQRISRSGKVGKRASGVSVGSPNPGSKRGSEKRKYVLRDNIKKGSLKDRPPFIIMSRKEDQQSAVDKSVTIPSAMEKEALGDEFGVVESGKSRFVILKGKDKDISDASRVLVQRQSVTSVKGSPSSTSRNSQTSGRNIKSILSKEGRADQSHVTASSLDQQSQAANVEKEKRLPRPPNQSLHVKDHISRSSSVASVSDGDDKKYIDDKIVVNNKHGSPLISERHERRTRNKERPDRGVWAPLRRSGRSQTSDGIHPSSEAAQMVAHSLEGISISQPATGKVGDEEMVVSNARFGRNTSSHAAYDMSSGYGKAEDSRSDEMKIRGGGRVDSSPMENGSHRQVGRRGPLRGPREVDNSVNLSEGKSSKRGSTVYNPHERQVWVQKSGSAS